MTPAELMAEHGSPLWLVDLDRVRARLREFRAAWTAGVARDGGGLLLQDEPPAGHPARAGRRGRRARGRVRGRVRAGARRASAPPGRRHRQRPGQAGRAARARRGRRRPRLVDSEAELERAARPASSASACASRCPASASSPTRFGIAPGEVAAAAAARDGLGLDARGAERAPRLDRLRPPLARAPRLARGDHRQLAARRPRARAAAAARAGGALASGLGVAAIDLGGGFPAAPAVAAHAAAVADALRAGGFGGRLMLEPGRRARHRRRRPRLQRGRRSSGLDDGTRCVVVDAGTNLLPATLWSWPRIEAARRGRRRDGPGARQRAAVPERRRPAPGRAAARPGAAATRCIVRDAGAYQQAQSTRFGDLRPAVVAREDGRWRVCRAA